MISFIETRKFGDLLDEVRDEQRKYEIELLPVDS